jgi:hypothetical protein
VRACCWEKKFGGRRHDGCYRTNCSPSNWFWRALYHCFGVAEEDIQQQQLPPDEQTRQQVHDHEVTDEGRIARNLIKVHFQVSALPHLQLPCSQTTVNDKSDWLNHLLQKMWPYGALP